MEIRSNLWLAAVVLASFTPNGASAVDAHQEVPFEFARELIVVNGTVEGEHRAKMLIDTGASCTLVSRHLVEKLKLRLMPYSRSFVAHGQAADRPMALVHDISLGPIRSSRSCLVTEIPVPGVDMIIGLDVLRRHNFTIDLESKWIIFEACKPAGATIPFDIEAPLIVVPALCEGRVIRLMIDTGSVDLCLYRNRIEAWISKTRAGQGAIAGMLGDHAGREVWVRDLVIGTTTWKTTRALVLEAGGASLPAFNNTIDGFVGLKPLGLKRIHFDFEHGILSWQR